jgi:hypothetical protein
LILVSFIIPLMNRFAGNISGYNLFVSRNKNNFDADGILVQADINFGTGRLGDTPITSAVVDVSGQAINVDWGTALDNPYKLATDVAYILCIDSTTDEILFQMNSAGDVDRSGGSWGGSLSEVPVLGRAYWVYLVFLRADGTQVGNTAYISTNAVA